MDTLSTARKFLAAWIGATIGYISAGTGVAYRAKQLEIWLAFVEEDQSNVLLTLGVIIVFAAIHTTAVMLGYHEEEKSARGTQQTVSTRNYFLSGLMSACFVCLIFTYFAGFDIIEADKVIELLTGG